MRNKTDCEWILLTGTMSPIRGIRNATINANTENNTTEIKKISHIVLY